jgi:hypothetical protein
MPTLDLQVGADSDNAKRYWDGSSWVWEQPAYSGQDTGYYTSAVCKMGGGMRFTNVTIPQGASITAAYLTLRSRYTTSVTVVNSRIKGEAADNAATFSTEADFNGRARTTASVDWDNIPAWTNGVDYNSPGIKTIIQEIVNRSGWASGNALVIFWDDFDDRSTHANDACRLAKCYAQGAATAPKLHIEYTAITEKTSSDTGSGVDTYVALETPGAKLSSDIGSGVEGTPLPSASLAGNETGAGIEVLAARLLASCDTGTGVEVAQLVGSLKELFAAELGEGRDLLTAKIEIPTKGGGMKLWT